jgi:hypothetical protein
MAQTREVAVEILPEVEAFALERGVAEHLPTVLAVARQALPEATLSLALETDPEVEGLQHIVVIARGVRRNVEQSLAAYDDWHRGLFAQIPAPMVCTFRLGLEYAT